MYSVQLLYPSCIPAHPLTKPSDCFQTSDFYRHEPALLHNKWVPEVLIYSLSNLYCTRSWLLLHKLRISIQVQTAVTEPNGDKAKQDCDGKYRIRCGGVVVCYVPCNRRVTGSNLPQATQQPLYKFLSQNWLLARQREAT